MQEGKSTRERILNMASKLVHQKGFGPTSLSDILETTGIKKGTFYYHFSSKDDLGLAVLGNAKAEFLDSLNNVLTAPTPIKGLQQFFDYVLKQHRKMRFTGGCLFGNTALEMSDSSSRYSECVSGIFQEWISRIESVILAGQQDGQFRTDIPAMNLAQVIVSTIEGGIMMSRLEKKENPLKICLQTLMTFLQVEETRQILPPTKQNPIEQHSERRWGK